MQNNYDKIKATGAELFAISSDNVNSSKSTVQDRGLTFPVLADFDLNVIKAYNVVGLDNIRIAQASSFVIGMDGKITWVTIDEWDQRTPTDEILTALEDL
ncbi:redoxin domain-containing protein [Candidatus Poribacteria bacterium]|nr:redoxin domain-containing protein [Candidatus Poribacteria bacterium]MYB63334.1 redoxin domain-containing protein [Candidatus Poribacteria bacterium]MYF54273.1 redoxin domain-containing protein [Candidatus Poribacteria bacterium]MYI94680.1 redoxin domain-containing protein [Candidatus Poribacteria bacterium]